MEPLIYLLLVLALVGDVLLAAVLVLTLRRSREEGDDGQLARTLQKVIESETDLLADQLRATQAETARSTQASVRDLGAILAESHRQGGGCPPESRRRCHRRPAGPAGKPAQRPGRLQRRPSGRHAGSPGPGAEHHPGGQQPQAG